MASRFGLDDETPSVVGKARCLFQLGGGREAIHILERHVAELRAASLSDPTSLVATLAALIPPYFEAGMVERAKEAASEGWRLAESASDLNDRACLYVNRAQLLLMQKDARGALASLSLAEDIYRQLDWQIDLVKVNLARALTLTDQGDLDTAESILRPVLDEADSLSATDRGQALSHIARVYRLRGDLVQAVDSAKAAVKSAPRSQPMVLGEAHRELGFCLRAQSERDRSLIEWKKALAAFELAGHHEEVARTARLIADHLVESGEVEAAVEYLRRGLSSVEEIG
jgi:tetratricopeptide (TPR) repeat protein